MTSDEATAEMVEAIEAAGIPYMLVGSFSSNVYGVVRSTKDADFVIQMSKGAVSAIMGNLAPTFSLDPQLRFESVTGTTRNIVSLSDDPHDGERFRRRRKIGHPVLGRDVDVPTAEDVIITKLRWALAADRGKDVDDIRDVIAVQGLEGLDWEYIHHWTALHETRDLLDQIRSSIPRMNA